LFRNVHVFTLSTAHLQYFMCLPVLVRWQHKMFPRSRQRDTNEALEDAIDFLINIAVARHLLSMWPEKNITNMYIIFELLLYKVRMN
jgi:hypothetical protein